MVEHPLAVDLHAHPLGEGVDHGGAHAVKSAGDGVGLAAELAAGVEGCHHRLHSRLAGGLVGLYRDAVAVVVDADRAVLLYLYVGPGGAPSHELVDRVVDDLEDQVVEAALPGAADVHPRPLADRLHPLQYLDVAGSVCLGIHTDIGLCHTELLSANQRCCGPAAGSRSVG